MKIIDLLNKIANEEDVPKYIKVYDDIYEYDNLDNLYWNSNNKQLLDVYNGRILNYEAEIIEEEKKIPDEININLAYIDKEYLLDKEDVDRKINEIINRHNILVNKVSDYLKSKGDE